MASPYTVGTWYVKTGKEDEFIKAWNEMAKWSKAQFEGAISVMLLRDENDGRRFISLGPWRSKNDIEQWRASEGFRTRVEQLKPLLERFEPALFEPVVVLEA